MIELLIVYIHGFLGSIDSFHSFPQDLFTKLGINSSYKIYPTYDTKGNNTKAIHALADWLLIHCTTITAKKVVLIGHSMGGILAVDAFNYLKSLNSEGLVNIIGIYTFDSPFYGLSNHTTKSSVTNIKEVVSQIKPTDLIPSSVPDPVNTWISQKVSFQSITESKWSLAIVGTAAVASVLSFSSSIGVSGLLYLGKKADQVTDHLRFLFPLASSTKEMHSRVKGIIDQDEQGILNFHAFYLEIPDSKSHFCALPPIELTNSSKYFSPINTKLKDEIQGHMYIFSEKINTTEYSNLIDITADYIQKLI